MAPHFNGPAGTFLQRLNVLADLPADLSTVLHDLVANSRSLGANHDIVLQGDQPSQCCVILEGWVSRNKVGAAGKRQITSLHFSGATPDIQSLLHPVMDHNITTLTKTEVGFIPHSHMRSLMERFPVLKEAFWKDTLLELAIAREWEVNLGARSAVERTAHLFCEMATRLEWFGRATRSGSALRFELPLTQIQLGEATGLSSVHINRSMRTLRNSGMIEQSRHWFTISDLPKLAAFADFNPDYLLAERPRD